jgi:hypothetical protein
MSCRFLLAGFQLSLIGRFWVSPEDWHTSVEEDLGFTSDTLHEQFFAPYWEDIVLGRAGLMEHLTTALQKIAPHVRPAEFAAYWFEKDSCLAAPLLQELSLVRSAAVEAALPVDDHLECIASTQQRAPNEDGVDGMRLFGCNTEVIRIEKQWWWRKRLWLSWRAAATR